nr:hypothetical protein [Paenibacillus rhizovicinus]
MDLFVLQLPLPDVFLLVRLQHDLLLEIENFRNRLADAQAFLAVFDVTVYDEHQRVLQVLERTHVPFRFESDPAMLIGDAHPLLQVFLVNSPAGHLDQMRLQRLPQPFDRTVACNDRLKRFYPCYRLVKTVHDFFDILAHERLNRLYKPHFVQRQDRSSHCFRMTGSWMSIDAGTVDWCPLRQLSSILWCFSPAKRCKTGMKNFLFIFGGLFWVILGSLPLSNHAFLPKIVLIHCSINF